VTYIEKSLGDGERVVALAHFHWWYDVVSWLELIVPAALLIGVLLSVQDTNARNAVSLAALGLLALGFLAFLSRMIRKWTTEIGVTSHRFVKKTGFIRLKTNEIALPNIEGVRVVQSLWGRIWGYGHLRIEGTGVDAVELPTIGDPVGFRRAIETAKGIKS
jgi:uncharacterized membrane protein YdbT with pleckstrin-like domain